MSAEESRQLGLPGRVYRLTGTTFPLLAALTIILMLCDVIAPEQRIFVSAFLVVGCAMMACALLGLVAFAVDSKQCSQVEMKFWSGERPRWYGIVLLCVMGSLPYAIHNADEGAGYVLARFFLLVAGFVLWFVLLGVVIPARLAKAVKGDGAERVRGKAADIGIFIAFLTLGSWSIWYQVGSEDIVNWAQSLTPARIGNWATTEVVGLLAAVLGLGHAQHAQAAIRQELRLSGHASPRFLRQVA